MHVEKYTHYGFERHNIKGLTDSELQIIKDALKKYSVSDVGIMKLSFIDDIRDKLEEE